LHTREKRWSYIFLGASSLRQTAVNGTPLTPGECPPFDPDAT
jgi:hypothetical protein